MIHIPEHEFALLTTIETHMHQLREQVDSPGRINTFIFYSYHAFHRNVLSSRIRQSDIERSRKSLYRDRQKWEEIAADSKDPYEVAIYTELLSMFAFYSQILADYEATWLSMTLMLYYLEESLAVGKEPLVFASNVVLESKLLAVQVIVHRWSKYYPMLSAASDAQIEDSDDG